MKREVAHSCGAIEVIYEAWSHQDYQHTYNDFDSGLYIASALGQTLPLPRNLISALLNDNSYCL